MLGFLRKRVLKEHMKIVAQNYQALSYCQAFLPTHEAQLFSQVISDVNAAWTPGTKLSDDQFKSMWRMNSVLRRVYDQSPARAFGKKLFDKEFVPLLGWDEYYSRYI